MSNAITAASFYGKSCSKLNLTSKDQIRVPYKINSLLSGPPLTWKIFRKQDVALNYMKKKGFGLMTYAFEDLSSRLFLVAHPEVFWHYDTQRNQDVRCTYEIIPEFSVCKLYFDLEFDKKHNPHKNGNLMTDTLIKLIMCSLKIKYKLDCKNKDILILDSTTNKKFSQHLIFNVPNICFLNNYHVGAFVQFINKEIVTSLNNKELTEHFRNAECDLEELKTLLVFNRSGETGLFFDESVYSKNRHFRLYNSTKRGKNSPLLLYKNGIVITNLNKQQDKELFLSSLITNIMQRDSVKVLEFVNKLDYEDSFSKYRESTSACLSTTISKSPFPKIDMFINNLVCPGKIYRSVYFSTSGTIVFDIVGYRYCGNIKREHKSNNVKYIVDLLNCVYYQKCHDRDCFHYKSEKMSLPSEICFYLSDNSDNLLGHKGDECVGLFNIPEGYDEVLEMVEDVPLGSLFEDNALIVPRSNSLSVPLYKFPSFGMPDDVFLNVPY